MTIYGSSVAVLDNSRILKNFRVENVSSLPSAGNAGRMVFNTSDNKLYYDTGTEFKAVGGAYSEYSSNVQQSSSVSTGTSYRGIYHPSSVSIGAYSTYWVVSESVTVPNDDSLVVADCFGVAESLGGHWVIALGRDNTKIAQGGNFLENYATFRYVHITEKPGAGTYTYQGGIYNNWGSTVGGYPGYSHTSSSTVESFILIVTVLSPE